MDLIFKGILSSDHPSNLKRCLIENRLIPAASSDAIPSNDCLRLFAICWDVLAHSDSSFEQEMALKVWKTWSSSRKQEFEAFLPSITLSFSSGLIKNYQRCLEAVCHGLELFSGSTSGITNSSSPGAYEHLSSLAENLIRGLAESDDVALEALASATDSLICYEEEEETGLACNFCRPGIVVCSLLHRLAATPFRHGHNSHSFYHAATRIAAFLKQLFRIYPACATEAVAFICRLLADPCGTSFYSTLAPVIEVIDIRHGEAVLKVLQQGNNLGGASGHPHGPQLILAISRLLNMLYWPLASKCLPQWLAFALRSLGPLRQTPLFISLLNSKLLEIFEMLFIPASCHAATAVFRDILLSYQPAHEPFDKIVRKLPNLYERLREENNEDWVTLATSFMLFFKVNQDYHRLYGHNCISLLEQSIDKDLFCQLEEQYVSRGQRAAMVHHDPLHPPTAGLDNIGNTCYINSVLQALFSTTQFRNLVFKSRSHPESHTPLQDLRELFAFLCLTKRPSVNPFIYMQSLRPTYFLQGEQQDCQEYMHYLLNQLPSLDNREDPSHDENGAAAGNSCTSTPSYLPFGVTTQTSHVCQTCLNKTVQKEERNLDLMLHFQKGALTSDLSVLSRDVGIMASPYDVPGPPSSFSLVNNEASTSTSTNNPPSNELLPMLTYDGQTKGGGTVNETFPQKMIMAPEVATAGQRSDEKDDLDDLLKAIHEGEIIDYFCENCRKDVKALRRTDIVELPSHLILTVLRHSHTNHRPAKILRRICFPEVLTFPPMSQPSALYTLYALIVHQGPHMHCGHYFTYAKSSCFRSFTNHAPPPPDTWYLFNDCMVTSTTFKEFSARDDTRQNIYQLFYRKLDDEEEIDDDISALQMLDFSLRQKITDDNEQYIQSLESGSSQKAVVPVTKKPDSHGPSSSGGGCGEGFGSLDIFSSRCIF